MSSNMSKTLKTKLKKQARHIQHDFNVSYSQALEIAAKEKGFPSYHALQAVKKNDNHKADIVNANLGTCGINDTYAKAMGNRGKQLNPNQKHSLVLTLNPRSEVNILAVINGKRCVTEKVRLLDDFLQKVFVERHGARILGTKEINARSFQRLYRCTVHTLYVEFLSDTPWEAKVAFDLIRDCLFPHSNEYSLNSYSCSDIIWLDGSPIKNFNYDDERYAEPDYHPAIDGY
ncbi:hypothetical protein [Vibrio navarrensis]|uniref:hypothetical protein n=1 Tax=Vibrio navarrensis TaxID=29495 RepID=UPI00186857BF|nr:hypothetical protein [Vibrio navarrensis]MBE3653899.1 hypothetical protein [Vibrio navarrensis]